MANILPASGRNRTSSPLWEDVALRGWSNHCARIDPVEKKDMLFGSTDIAEGLRSEPDFYPKAPVANVYAIRETGHVLALSDNSAHHKRNHL